MAQITVCVPVYNAAEFIAETLDRVAAQTFTDFKVLISIDRATDRSEEICRRYLTRPNWELIVQPKNLGWVGNVNALIERVDTPYFCITPHDDLLDSRYLAKLYAVAEADTAISCVYSDIQSFGSRAMAIAQPEIRGGRLERVCDFFLNHYVAISFRGLIRRNHRNDRPFLPEGLRRNFAADTVWILDLAVRGELRRIPECLYFKRYMKSTVHAAWSRWERQEVLSLWAEQAAHCVQRALPHFDDADERTMILAAGLMRASGASRPSVFSPQDPLETAMAAPAFWSELNRVLPKLDLKAVMSPAIVDRLFAISRYPWDNRPRPATLQQRVRRRSIRFFRQLTGGWH